MMLDDVKVHVRLKLSALWASLMFCYVYCDYFELYQRGKLQGMLQGRMAPFAPASQGVLLAASVVMAIPSVMVFVSLVLRPSADRWVNVVVGSMYSAIMLAIVAAPGVWMFYRFMGTVETVLSLLIVWHAWTWPKSPSEQAPFSPAPPSARRAVS